MGSDLNQDLKNGLKVCPVMRDTDRAEQPSSSPDSMANLRSVFKMFIGPPIDRRPAQA